MHIKSLSLAAALALASISSVSTAATNLIGNGDFEAGNTGFVSAYVNSPTNLQPAGTYGVISNPLDAHPLWSSFGDHTTGSGLMMAMNGASTVTTVWAESGIAVLPNTVYYFSAWVASNHPGSPATLKFSVNGIQLGQLFAASSTTGLWQQFYTTWNSGSATSADFGIVDTSLTTGGNDFSLDDISLSTDVVPEPATWGLLLIGFAAVGVAARSGRKTAVAA